MTKASPEETDRLFAIHQTGYGGLSDAEATARLQEKGPNALPEPESPGLALIFVRQFLNPLIYILLIAAAVSLVLGDMLDSLFIGIVLLVNGSIGAAQEYAAGRSAAALRSLEVPHALAIRNGRDQEIDSRLLVPGDLVRLESGNRVPADIRLIETQGLEIEEAAMTGESIPVSKDAAAPSQAQAVIAEQRNMAFAGTVITHGRGYGIVSATGLETEIGKIAQSIRQPSAAKPPLMIRMERFTRWIAIAVTVAVVALALAGVARGMEPHDMFMMAVALAVAAIPEGLPIAISVALAIGMRRMARRQVIVRNMPAVESLGSCTMIATDKTGTLTLNSLSVTDSILPDNNGGTVLTDGLESLLRAAVLANEAALSSDGKSAAGDSVDVALVEFAVRAGLPVADVRTDFPLIARIPYEPEQKYAASFHRDGAHILVCVKGAPSTLRAMSARMQTGNDSIAIDTGLLTAQKEKMATEGLRVLAFASGYLTPRDDDCYSADDLRDLTFLGMTGMQDPVRPEVPDAIRSCYNAGIAVVMVTGDDARTAAAIAQQAGLAFSPDDVITGPQLRDAEAQGDAAVDELTRRARIYARVEPAQKLTIVNSLARNGHFVAVTGDGVNDAPALRHAHVGVAMGRKGTDIARDSSDIILSDDNFASIVAGIQEGRVAYANIRKVIFLLVSTGAAEVVLFLLAMIFGTPVPLLAVQLLWLNLVTNGIQDVALACEKAEGDELGHPPRKPREPIFNRVMIERVIYTTLVMGVGGFATFYWLLAQGYDEHVARNLLLLLMVLFENFQALNSRSEHRSVFRQSLRANPFLILGIAGAQALHISALYMPGLSDVLHLEPVSLSAWLVLLGMASSLMIVMEIVKWRMRHKKRSP